MVTFAEVWSPIKQLGIWGVVGITIVGVIIVVGLILWIVIHQKKKWYLQVLLKMPRDGARTIVAESAKGYWNSRKGTLWVKRGGLFGSKFFVELDDVRKYLQGEGFIELIGSGVNWKPVLFESYLEVQDEATGQKASILNYSMDFTRDKAWAIRAEREYVDTFSLSDVFNKLKDYIGWGLVIGIVILAEVVRVAYVGA